MTFPARAFLIVEALLLLFPQPGRAQTYEITGTRAAGMGGAFVAVADDVSAVYWNPAGLAFGSFFSLELDHNSAKAHRPSDIRSGSQSSTFLALAVPALGFSYYRLQASFVEDPPVGLVPPFLDGPASRVASLTTHHLGVTLVQSLTSNVAIGTTLKMVRGSATSGLVPAGDREELLDDLDNLVGRRETKFDADIGVMATAGALRVGLAARNVGDHEFDIAGNGEPLTLHRQVRAGLAYTVARGAIVSADLDLESVPGTLGLVRNFAAGGEARLTRRALVRGGFRFNTRDDQPGGRAPVGTAGASYLVFGSMLVDGQVTWGREGTDRSWGVGGRVVF